MPWQGHRDRGSAVFLKKGLAKEYYHTHCVLYSMYDTAINNNPDLFENLRLELRRGTLVLAVLATLRSERYGYRLRKALGESGLEVDENTLYPLLRRLETPGVARKRVARGEQAQQTVLPALPGRRTDASAASRRMAENPRRRESNPQ